MELPHCDRVNIEHVSGMLPITDDIREHAKTCQYCRLLLRAAGLLEAQNLD